MMEPCLSALRISGPRATGRCLFAAMRRCPPPRLAAHRAGEAPARGRRYSPPGLAAGPPAKASPQLPVRRGGAGAGRWRGLRWAPRRASRAGRAGGPPSKHPCPWLASCQRRARARRGTRRQRREPAGHPRARRSAGTCEHLRLGPGSGLSQPVCAPRCRPSAPPQQAAGVKAAQRLPAPGGLLSAVPDAATGGQGRHAATLGRLAGPCQRQPCRRGAASNARAGRPWARGSAGSVEGRGQHCGWH